jgi:Synergist-CTERM protein sorting domain-containing protein
VTWNGLTLDWSAGSSIAVTGTPAATGTGTFQVTATVGGVTTTQTFNINVTAGSSGGSIFDSFSEWEKSVNARNGYFHLYIPVTSSFVSTFAASGSSRVTTADIQSIVASATSTYATLTSSNVSFYEMLSGGDHGILHVRLDFTPASGHETDWVQSVVLNSLTITGANGAVASGSGPSGSGSLYALPNRSGGGGGGCSAGFAGLALLLAAPLFLKKKD